MKRLIVVLLLAVCLILGGCPSGSVIDNIDPANIQGMTEEDLDALFASLLPGPALPPAGVSASPICTDYIDRGLLRVCYKNESGARVKLQVLLGRDNWIAYDLKGGGSPEDFPLQLGEGEYTARIMQNLKNDEYFSVESESFTPQFKDAAGIFLNSVQNVNWNYEMEPIHDVRYIVAGSLKKPKNADLLYSCVTDIYNYIVKNIKYDNDKVNNLPMDYLPDIEQTYRDNKGICYDYSSLFAAMLRSIGVPAKLVTGYASYSPDVYHAWNEVYINGKWITIDTTRDATLLAGGSSYKMEKNSEDYSIVHVY